MTSRDAFLWTSSAILVVGLGAVWHFSHQAHHIRANLETVRSDVLELNQELAQLREAARNAKAGAKPEANAPGLPTSPQRGLPSAAELDSGAQARAQERERALQASPPLQVLFEESRRGMYHGLFMALFQRLKLSPEQRTSFIDALVTWDMNSRDLDAVMKERGLARNDPALRASRAEADAKYAADLQAVLGPDAITIIRDYTRLNEVRSYVAGYGGLFSRLGQPLTFAQLEALVNAFGDAAPDSAPQTRKLTTAQWDQIRKQAKEILTHEQWSVYEATTSPGKSSGRWDSEATEALERTAPPEGK